MKNMAMAFQPFSWNRLCYMITTVIIVLMLGGCIGDRSAQIPKVSSTNLENESINKIKLFDSIEAAEFVKQYGSQLEKIPNDLYNYYKLNNGLIIAANKNGEIVRISTPSHDDSFKTVKDISIKSTRDVIINAYGPNYYERSDELGYNVLGYIDHAKKITIEFFFTQEGGVLDHINLDLLEVN